jgi:hypothetical protein
MGGQRGRRCSKKEWFGGRWPRGKNSAGGTVDVMRPEKLVGAELLDFD